MRRDRAAFVRLIAWLLSIVLATSGLLVATTAAATAAPQPVAVASSTDGSIQAVAPPGVRTRPAPAHRTAGLLRSIAAAAVSGTAHITGHVTTDDGEPLADVVVVAYRWSDVDEQWDDVRYLYTSSDGSYDLSGLPADTYRVAFYSDELDGYESEYWDDAASLDEATDIELADGQTIAGTDARLTEQGRITGIVTGSDGQPLPGIEVTAYAKEQDDEEDYWYEYTSATTAADGSYDLGGLESGTVRVGFFDHYTGYTGEYWHDTQSWQDATDLEVSAGVVVTGVDAELAVGGAISGVITGPDGAPLEDIEVDTYRWDAATASWDWVYYTFSVDGGHYSSFGLPTGLYRFGYADDSGEYAIEYWNNSKTLSAATDVQVTAGTALPGFNVQLDGYGRISGTVSDADGAELEDVLVTLYRRSEDGVWQYYDGTYTYDDGSYSVGGIEPGTYRVRFTSYDGYLTEYWDDVSTFEAATDITVALGQRVRRIDALLATASTPAIVSSVTPTVLGDPTVGSPLTVSPGTWAPDNGLTYRYQWIVGGHDVTGATSPTYVPTGADAGQPVQVRVRVSRLGYTAGTATSAATAAVRPAVVALSNVVRPSIGTATVGDVVRAKPGTWSPTHESVSYQWLVQGDLVPGATSASYVPVPSDVGKRLEVRVTATAAGHTVGVASSAARIVGKGVLTATRKPRVTGAARKNATLTAFPGAWGPKATVRLQWYAGAKAIPKATATRLKLAGKTLKTVTGKAISVVVTVTAPGYNTATMRLTVAGKIGAR